MTTLSFKTPVEKFLGHIEKKDVEDILRSSVERVKRDTTSKGDLFAYELPQDLKMICTSKLGIDLHPVPYRSHSHPFSKIMENHMLYNVAPVHMQSGSWQFISIKSSKIYRFAQISNKGDMSKFKFLNRVIDAKDFGRYNIEVDDESIREFHHSFGRDRLFPNNLLKACERTNVFIHDEVHHWMYEDMVHFLDKARPKRLLCTVVFPPEIIKGLQRSLNPKMYTFKMRGDKFFYMPDGRTSEMYEQSIEGGWLLKCKYIKFNDRIWTVKMIKSCYSHHLFEIVPGKFVTDSRRFFSDYSCIDFTKLSETRFCTGEYPIVEYDLILKVYTYLACLKKPDIQSGIAKIRQLIPDVADPVAATFFSNFCKLLIEHSDRKDFMHLSWFDVVKDAAIDSLPLWCKRILPGYKAKNLQEFMIGLGKFEVEVICSEMDKFSAKNFLASDFKCTWDRLVDSLLCKKDQAKFINRESIIEKMSISMREEFFSYPEANAKQLTHSLNFLFAKKRAQIKDIQEAEKFDFVRRNSYKIMFLTDKPHGEMEFEKRKSHFTEYNLAVSAIFSRRSFTGLEGRKRKENPTLQDKTGELMGVEKGLVVEERSLPETEEILERAEKEGKGKEEKYDGELVALDLNSGLLIQPTVQNNLVEANLLAEVIDKDEARIFENARAFLLETDSANESEAELTAYRLMRGIFVESMTCGVEFPCGNLDKEVIDQSDLDSLRGTRINGRDAFFSSRDSYIDYGHNRIKYIQNDWIPRFDEIIAECGEHPSNYNAVLIQRYIEGGKIGFHKDDEACYVGGQILTINVCGNAETSFSHSKSERDLCWTIQAFGPSFYIMTEEMNKGHFHRVESKSEGRISMTFRKHVRTMSGAPFLREGFNEMARNKCLLRAVAKGLKLTVHDVCVKLMNKNPSFWDTFVNGDYVADTETIAMISADLNINIKVSRDKKILNYFSSEVCPTLEFLWDDDHIKLAVLSKSKIDSFVQRQVKNEVDSTFQKTFLSILASSQGYNEIQYSATDERAGTLLKCFLTGKTGVLLSSVKSGGEKIGNLVSGKREIIHKMLHAVFGFAGSGKSRFIQSFLSGPRSNENFLVVSPRRNLKDDWVRKIDGVKSGKIVTFESLFNLSLRKTQVLILDEISLFPNGYMDLLIYKLEKENRLLELVVLGDPFQARYHSESDESLLTFEHDLDVMIKGQDINYIARSFRLSSEFYASIFTGINVLGTLNGKEIGKNYSNIMQIEAENRSGNGNEIDCILVASQDEKRVYKCSIPIMTFGESQGLTFNHACIVCSEESASQDEFRWMVALTRSRFCVSFCTTYIGGLSNFMAKMNNRLFEAFNSEKGISEKRMRAMVECNLIMHKEVAGSDEMDREERLEGDVFLKPFIFLGQRIDVEDDLAPTVEVVEPKGATHLCLAQENFPLAKSFDLIRAKELREFRSRDMVTEQFTDSYEKNFRSSTQTCAPLRFEAIYPRHRTTDDLTFWMAVQKRLRFSDSSIERRKLNNAMGIGAMLFQNFKKKLKFDIKFDETTFSEAVNEFEKKKLQKSKAVLANHSIRSDNDWHWNDIFLFMKNQLCTKFEKQFVDAKAGQTLACFQHMILVKFAPWCRFMEKAFRDQLPEELYIHSNKNFNDLNDWVKKFFKDETCVESDYESFDASQDQYILAFEMYVMEDMGIPRQIIDDYVELKLNLGCKLGSFAVMRFTGEFCTFFFNTLANIAFTLARYEWKEGSPIAFAGDDMCAFENLKESTEFDEIFEKISLKAKVDRVQTPMFCGWRLSRHGIVKEPELIYNRFEIAKERGNVLECLESYAIEASYAYSLGEKLYEVLNEDQIEYHQAVVRFIVRHLSKLRTNVKTLFEEQSSDDEFCD